jgi:excisionase family DNA binding protein
MPHPTTALYVRLPQPEADKLDRAAEALATNKKALVTTLVSRYVDPDSPEGLDELRDLAAPQRRLDATPPHDAERGSSGVPRAQAAPPRRVTVDLPDAGMTVGHHAFLPSSQPEVLTPAQAAELLQVPEAEIVALAEAGRLPGRRIGDHWRFARPALIAWLSEG